MPYRERVRRQKGSCVRRGPQSVPTQSSADVEEMLWEMAFVLHLTEAIKEQLLAEKHGRRPSMPLAPFSYETSGS